MSAVIGLGNVQAAAASPRPARRRPVPPSLPRGLGRLCALAVAMPVTVLVAHAVGAAGLPLIQTLPLVLASALLLVLVALGVQLRGILVTAVVVVVPAISGAIVAFTFRESPGLSRLGLTEFVIRIGLLVTAPGDATAFVLLLAVAASFVFAVVVYSISRGARRLVRGLALGMAAAFAATAWPLLAILGVGFVGEAAPVANLWAAATAPVAWLAAAAGRTAALRPGVTLAVMRDSVFRVLTLAAALTSAVWVGQAVEIQAGRAAMGSPLESLAVSGGWTVALVLFAILGWTAWHMPRWLVVGQLRGRFEAVAVSETLVAAAVCCLVPLVFWRLDDTRVILGREWLVALAAALSYGWIRLWFAAPAPVASVSLWILMPNGTRGQAASLAAKAAGVWRAGQVTILAAPEDAPRISGEHLWAADLARETEALFPVRPVHLDDWVDAQPEAWPALPVRELYAPAEVWPQALGAHLEGSACALVVRGPDGPHPVTYFLDRRPMIVALLPRSSAPAVHPGTTAAQLTSLAATTIDQGELRNELRSLAPRSRPVRRFVVMFCTIETLGPAERVARLIHAQLDAEGRTVDCHVVRRGAAWWKLPRFQLGVWRLAALVLARSIGRGAPGSLKERLAGWFVTPLLGDDGATELDVVAWEGPAGVLPSSAPALAVDRFVAVRAAGARPPEAPTVPDARETGEIRLARDDSTEAVAEMVARKLLAYEVTPLTRVAADAPPAQVAEAPMSDPSPMTAAGAPETAPAAAETTPLPEPGQVAAGFLYVISSRIHWTDPASRLVRSLRQAVPWEVNHSADFDFGPESIPPEEGTRVQMASARAVLVVIDPLFAGGVGATGAVDKETMLVAAEIRLARALGKRIVPVLVDGASLDPLAEARPALRELTTLHAIRIEAGSWDRDVSALTIELQREETDTAVGASGRPVLFVSFSIIETTVYVHRPLLRGLREGLPSLEVIGSDFSVDFRDLDRRQRLESVLARAVAMLVIISRDGVRDDFVRQEVTVALERGLRVVPVLLDGARMPAPSELPPALAPLAQRNAIELDALSGGPDALRRFIDMVAVVVRADRFTAPAPAEASIRIYLFGDPADSGERARRLSYALRDRFGPDSTHVDTSTFGRPDGSPGTPASLPSGIVALARRLMLRAIVALARATAALAPRSSQSAVATLARRFLLRAITALTRGLPDSSLALLAHADVVLVVMGPTFAQAVQEVPADRVDAFRLRAALDMRLRILPVLVGGGVMPRGRDLPEDLRRLAELQAFEIREGAWNEGVDRLGDLIEHLTEGERGRPEPA